MTAAMVLGGETRSRLGSRRGSRTSAASAGSAIGKPETPLSRQRVSSNSRCGRTFLRNRRGRPDRSETRSEWSTAAVPPYQPTKGEAGQRRQTGWRGPTGALVLLVPERQQPKQGV